MTRRFCPRSSCFAGCSGACDEAAFHGRDGALVESPPHLWHLGVQRTETESQHSLRAHLSFAGVSFQPGSVAD